MSKEQISAFTAIKESIDFIRPVLFQRFDLSKWFTLGFLAFLGANLQTGGGYFPGINNTWDTNRGRWEGDLSRLMDLLPVLIAVVAVVLLIVVIIGIAWAFVKSRGCFMFLEGLALNQVEVVAGWKRNRRAGQSVFLWYVGFTIFQLMLAVLFLITAGLILFQDGQFQPWTLIWKDLLLLGVAALLIFVPVELAKLFFEDFIIPLMWSHRLLVMEAWGRLLNLLQRYSGPFLLYVVVRFVLSMAVSAVMLFGSCLTCCIGALPVLQQTLFLPFFGFMRMYPVFFLRQMDPAVGSRLWQPPAPQQPGPPPPPPVPPEAGRDNGSESVAM